MRKISCWFLLTVFFALALASASYGATAQGITLVVNGTDTIASSKTNPVPAVYSGDEVVDEGKNGEVSFPALSGSNYTFETVTDALDFAISPRNYISTHYTGSELDDQSYDITFDASFPEQSGRPISTTVTVSIQIPAITPTVDLSDYSAITDLTFTATQAITAPYGERHFIAGGNSTVTFSNITFSGSDNTAGGIDISSGTVNITGCTFNRCDTSNNGGAVSVTRGTVIVSNVTFTGNSATNNGGGLSVTGGNVSVTNTTFTSNSASGNGGGLSVTSGTVTVSSTTFTENTASDYGGALSQTNGTTTITGSTTIFRGNNAYSGGALSLTGGNLTVSEATFIGNDATQGGAIYSSSGLTVGAGVNFNTLSLSSPNTAERGGAIYVAGGTTTISGSQVSFTENRADYGGAIYAFSGTVDVSGAGITFSNNVVSNDGGAIWSGAGSEVSLKGDSLTVASNMANDGSGGAIYASGDRSKLTISSTTSDFASNYASANGGAILSGGGNNLTISGAATFTTNNATYGGAIYLGATNRARTALSIKGGSEATFTRNTASISGGGIYAQSYSTITLEPTATFTGNNAVDGNGGAIWLAESSQLPEGTIYFSDNTATKSASNLTDIGSGGAVYIAGSSSTPVTIGTTRKYDFSGNTASSYGGAICTYSSDITFDSYTQNVANSAVLGGGFAASYYGKIMVNNSSFSNQTTQGRGGAIWAHDIETVSSDFSANSSTGTGNHIGGGALYSLGELTLTRSVFTENSASQGGGAAYSYNGELEVTDSTFTQNTAIQGGGAAYAEASTVSISNSYFATNSTTSGNGGAVALQGFCRSTVTSSTFRNNTSTKLDGGAIYAQGTLSITLCFLRENRSLRSGGAIYFNQNSDNPSNYSKFTMTSTMLEENSTLGVEGNGGGLYVVANDATLTACTFNGNRLVLAGNAGEGGGAYISAYPIQNENIEITNCTFYDNHIDDGTDNSGGGGLAIHCEKTTVVRSCTFALNGAKNGGGIYLGDGSNLQISGTMLVGNTDNEAYDIWSDGNITSGGYNRIGVYGTGTGATDFYSQTRNESDRSSPTDSSQKWTRYTFYSNNTLAVNERSDLGSNIPPYLGSTLTSQTRLMTLMLSEDATLPAEDRATNIIPYTRRAQFPTTDARGVPRIPSGSTIALDIGACFYDYTRYTDSENPVEAFTISRVEISGIPNTLRRVGQTASLIAKIYYTNGRTALGGTAAGEEPVEWTSDKPNIIRINKDTGDITVLNFTPGNTYVTITVKTSRIGAGGTQATDSKPIKVTEYTYSYLNTTPDIVNYLQGYTEQLTEYDISIQLADNDGSAVNASTFQSSFASLWSTTASQVKDLTAANLTFNTAKSYTASDGYTLPKNKAGVSVNLSGISEGAVFPLVYTWNFSGKELNDILGYNMAEETITSSLADKIFGAMRIDFEGAASSHVIGTGGVKASDAMRAGALTLSKTDGDAGLHAELTAYLANVTSSGNVSANSVENSKNNDGPQIVDGLLVVPDGNGNDGKISGTMWMAGKTGSAGNGGGKGTTQASGGGGGGCAAFGMMLIFPVIIFRRKQ